MQEFLEATTNFSPIQLLTSLAVLTPFVAGIWVAMKWAYDTRLKNLETALADFRTDFDRKLSREVAKTTDAHEQDLAALKQALDSANSQVAKLELGLKDATVRLDLREQTIDSRANDLGTAESALANLLTDLIASDRLPRTCLSYLAVHPRLISQMQFGMKQVDDLRIRAEENELDAMYVYGRLLLMGRILADGYVSQNKDAGMALIRAAAEHDHEPSRSFKP